MKTIKAAKELEDRINGIIERDRLMTISELFAMVNKRREMIEKAYGLLPRTLNVSFYLGQCRVVASVVNGEVK